MSSKTPDYTKSAEIQAQGYRDAAKIQAESEAEARALQEKQYNQSMDYLNAQNKDFLAQRENVQSIYNPYVQSGQAANTELGNIVSDPNSWLNKQYTGEDLQNDPGYKFRLNQGTQALNNSAAAKNGLLSGTQSKALNEYNQNYASNEFGAANARYQQGIGNRYNALIAQLNTGLSGTAGYAGASQASPVYSSLANAASNYGNTMTDIISGGAATQSGLTLQAANTNAYYNQLAQGGGGNGMGGALSGALSGAAAGAMTGNPFVALGGAVIGGAAGYFAGNSQGGSADQSAMGANAGNSIGSIYKFSQK